MVFLGEPCPLRLSGFSSLASTPLCSKSVSRRESRRSHASRFPSREPSFRQVRRLRLLECKLYLIQRRSRSRSPERSGGTSLCQSQVEDLLYSSFRKLIATYVGRSSRSLGTTLSPATSWTTSATVRKPRLCQLPTWSKCARSSAVRRRSGDNCLERKRRRNAPRRALSARSAGSPRRPSRT